MRTPSLRAAAVGVSVAALALLSVGCGSDDKTRTVTAVDYSFDDLPKTVTAGTEFTLENDSETELHEMVVIKVPDDEARPVSELMQLPEEQLDAIFQGEPAMVLLRAPGEGEQITAVGDGKLTEKGRYAVICAIPTGADPAAYLNAPPSDGPPTVAGGPPHFTQGMFGEVTVE